MSKPLNAGQLAARSKGGKVSQARHGAALIAYAQSAFLRSFDAQPDPKAALSAHMRWVRSNGKARPVHAAKTT